MDLFLPLLPLVAFVAWGLLRFGRFRWKNRGRQVGSGRDGGSLLLPRPLRAWWIEELGPLVGWLVRKGVRPDHISVTGALVSAVAAVLFGLGFLIWGGYAMLVGGGCDMLDGRVARTARLQTRRGAFLDSSLDRYADLLVLGGLAVAFRASWVGLVAVICMIGTVMVSYARARAEGLGVGCKVGLMQRPERFVVIAFAAILDPLVSHGINIGVHDFGGSVLLPGVLTVVTVLTHGTAVARIRTVYRELRDQEESPAAPEPEPRPDPPRTDDPAEAGLR